MFEQMRRLVEFLTSLGVFPTVLLYTATAKILPDWARFADGHAWWHILIVALVWIGVYLGTFLLFRWYARQQMDMLIARAQHNHGMRLFTRWQKWCCILFVFGFVLVPYLKLPKAMLIITCGCGVAVLIYDIIKAKLGAPFILLQQLYLTLLSAVYLILFSPIIFVLYMVVMLLLVFGVAAKDLLSPQILITRHYDSDGRFLRSEQETI